MIKRDFTADYINSVINHPSVRAGAQVIEDVDLSEFVKDPKNIILTYQGGGFVLIPRESSYEIHTQALPEGRGSKVRQAVEEMLEYMFERTERVTSMVKHGNEAALKLAREFLDETHADENYIYFEKVRCL
jgi:hypothetical protein